MSQYPDERSPQDEVPFSTITSPRGIPVDQLVSVLQKDIRRSNVDNAVLAAHEMLSTSAEVAAHYPSCIHTKAGREVGRGLRHWWENGARVNDELDTADHSYRDVSVARSLVPAD